MLQTVADFMVAFMNYLKVKGKEKSDIDDAALNVFTTE
ncbi:hypothetical protein KAOT1_02357 [Kordia algicida OT-1]|uniref:Uncharacterized protein n=1 Tax=Kordia algicida OT-1 TaxID=391587 RepID=A9DTM7_9FLAO|nr:hypothetical protein KAOT1_02357 [Kordia algicida OT-1]